MSLKTLVRDAIVRDEGADGVVGVGCPGEDGASCHTRDGPAGGSHGVDWGVGDDTGSGVDGWGGSRRGVAWTGGSAGVVNQEVIVDGLQEGTSSPVRCVRRTYCQLFIHQQVECKVLEGYSPK